MDFIKTEPMTVTTVRVSALDLELAKEKNLNLSKIFRAALKKALKEINKGLVNK